MDTYRIDFDALPWETPLPGLRCKAQRLGMRQLRLVEYDREMTPHWCERGHVGYVLDGRLEIRFDHRTDVFKPGDGINLPAGAAHRHMARVLTDTVRVVFVEEL